MSNHHEKWLAFVANSHLLITQVIQVHKPVQEEVRGIFDFLYFCVSCRLLPQDVFLVISGIDFEIPESIWRLSLSRILGDGRQLVPPISISGLRRLRWLGKDRFVQLYTAVAKAKPPQFFGSELC